VFINHKLQLYTGMAVTQKQVDLSKFAFKQYVMAIDANDNLVYVPALQWAYIDSDGSIVLDYRRLLEWKKRTGYTWIEEPFISCDESDCYRDWRECDRFVFYTNYEIIELNESTHSMKLKRKSDGVVFKFSQHPIWYYILLELEPSMNLCEFLVLYVALLAKLGRLSKEQLELLDQDPVGLIVQMGEAGIIIPYVLGTQAGLIIIQKK